jgi:hypothetical protein
MTSAFSLPGQFRGDLGPLVAGEELVFADDVGDVPLVGLADVDDDGSRRCVDRGFRSRGVTSQLGSKRSPGGSRVRRDLPLKRAGLAGCFAA